MMNSRLPAPIAGGSATDTHCRSCDGSPPVLLPGPCDMICMPARCTDRAPGPRVPGSTSLEAADSPFAFTAVKWYAYTVLRSDRRRHTTSRLPASVSSSAGAAAGELAVELVARDRRTVVVRRRPCEVVRRAGVLAAQARRRRRTATSYFAKSLGPFTWRAIVANALKLFGTRLPRRRRCSRRRSRPHPAVRRRR